MTTKMFRKDNGRLVSVLDLPGSVLLVPQESLVGHPLNKRQIQYKGACEQWWGAHLFSELVAACRELMSTSDKCTKASKKVEHGVYGPKQEIALSSMEPLTLLLEFWPPLGTCSGSWGIHRVQVEEISHCTGRTLTRALPQFCKLLILTKTSYRRFRKLMRNSSSISCITKKVQELWKLGQ